MPKPTNHSLRRVQPGRRKSVTSGSLSKPAETYAATAPTFLLGVHTVAVDAPISCSAEAAATVMARPWPCPRWSRWAPKGSINPGRPRPADQTVVVATPLPSRPYATRQRARRYAEDAAIARQCCSANVELGHDARCTEIRSSRTRSSTWSTSSTSTLRPQSSTGEVRSRHKGVHGSSAVQPVRYRRSRNAAPNLASMDP